MSERREKQNRRQGMDRKFFESQVSRLKANFGPTMGRKSQDDFTAYIEEVWTFTEKWDPLHWRMVVDLIMTTCSHSPKTFDFKRCYDGTRTEFTKQRQESTSGGPSASPCSLC